ncbi:MAG: hypothetical protein C0601_01885 [Candidatus Muiribacterium halophilum]|uniref:ABC transporter permease n=1 Tax=Muiribacterium halophilum TaxID=2053465 RepID=A0A2N5ZL53_MUIH1|nr:MAG: hypothetical protein C0601_01885 [Candidatus Muirbacterium halophilum]
MIVKMAFRNIFRHKIRTTLTMLAVFFGIFITLFGVSINNGMTRYAITQFIKTDIGVFKIYKKGFYKEREDLDPLKYIIKDDQNIKEKVKAIFPDADIETRLAFNGSLTNGDVELPIKIFGIDPENENKIFLRKDSVISGDYLNKGDSETVLIGEKNAELLKLKVGDYITLMTRDANKSMNAYDVMVKGIIKTGNNMVDENQVFINYSFAKDFVSTDFGNEIVASISETSQERIGERIQALQKNLKDAEVVPWYKEIEDFLKTMELDEKSGQIMMAIILLMAGVGITNTLIMAVYERKQEIGILYAMGFDRSRIISLFTLEGGFIGILAALVAGIAGGIMIMYGAKYGLNIPAGQESMKSIPVGSRIYTYLEPMKMFYYLLSGVIVACIASLYPAWFATRLNPVEIMRD